ncbi:MAG: hypothetical protein HC881_07980 [Leptolyngbyaceae cyanobacterium SL_7_1]|nr:hypothetical protein [Leptolyngbyaceae cyanobacterium SL_7_1]
MPTAIDDEIDPSARFAEWQPAAVLPDQPITSSDFYLDETDEVVETATASETWAMVDSPNDRSTIPAEPNGETSLVPLTEQSGYPSESSDLDATDPLLLDHSIDGAEPSKRRSDWLSVGGLLAVLTIGFVVAIIGYPSGGRSMQMPPCPTCSPPPPNHRMPPLLPRRNRLLAKIPGFSKKPGI